MATSTVISHHIIAGIIIVRTPPGSGGKLPTYRFITLNRPAIAA
jgi:hypothetical protein